MVTVLRTRELIRAWNEPAFAANAIRVGDDAERGFSRWLIGSVMTDVPMTGSHHHIVPSPLAEAKRMFADVQGECGGFPFIAVRSWCSDVCIRVEKSAVLFSAQSSYAAPNAATAA